MDKKKESSKPKVTSKKIKAVKADVQVEIIPDIEAKYADLGHVGFRGNHFYISFIQVPSPVFFDKNDRPDSIEVKGKYVGQVILSKENMQRFVEEVNELWDYSLQYQNEQKK